MRAAVLALAVLAGCSTVARTSFDPVEYDKYVMVSWAASDTASCGTPGMQLTVAMLNLTTSQARAYSDLKGVSNSRISEAAQIVQGLVGELQARYAGGTPSDAYCKLKLAEISGAAGKIATSLSNKEQ